MKRLLLTLLLLPSLAWGQNIGPGLQAVPLSLNGPKISGRFYGPPVISFPASNAVLAANRLMVMPMFFQTASTVKTLQYNITVGNAAAWNSRMCVYADTNGLPGALVIDSGTLAIGSGSVTGWQTATLAGGGVTLGGPAWYWVGFMADSASESVSGAGNTAAGPLYSSALLGWASQTNVTGQGISGVYMAQTFGACPAAFSGSPTFADSSALPYVVLGF